MYDDELMYKVLEIPTFSGSEHLLSAFVIAYAKARGINAHLDSKGNVYLKKGNLSMGEYYPCVTAHLDTIQQFQRLLVKHKRNLDIITDITEGKHRLYCKGVGIGGDDKAGVFICLSLMDALPALKAVFFVEEEMGCLGSIEADLSWFSDVGYIFSFDSPGTSFSWCCGGITLFDRDFYQNYLQPVEKEFGATKYCNHPYADIMYLRMNTSLACMNIGAGYYEYHTPYEFCVIEDMDNAINIGHCLIKSLGYKEYVIPYCPRWKNIDNLDDRFFLMKFHGL